MTTTFAAKLNGIEAGADVTDSTNVNAAGAVMESDYSPSHSILVQQSGTGSPSSLSIGNNTLVGRLSGGGSAIDDLSASQVRTLLNVEDGADVTDAANVASTIHAATSKTTPVDADEIPIADSEASFGLKKLTFVNLKAALNTLYVALTGNQTIAGNKTFSGDTAFTSTTRPTSGGTGTPAATSLITRADGDSRYPVFLSAVATSDLDRDSTITPTADPSLALTLTAGTWAIRGVVFISESTVLNTFGARLNVSATGASAAESSYVVKAFAGTAPNSFTSVGRPKVSFATTFPTPDLGAASSRFTFEIDVLLVVESSATLDVNWAQFVSNASPTRRYKGSYLTAMKTQ
jgi:hypothetical protein